MANLGVTVKIAADTSDFNRNMEKVGRQMNRLGRDMSASMGVIADTIHHTTDYSGAYWEQLRDRFVQANDKMQAKATQSKKIIDNLSRLDTRSLDQQFLKISDGLEKMAKKGSVANVAINEIGRNASMKDLIDQIKLITAGITRMQAVALAAGIVFVAMNAALFAAAKGPSPADIYKQQAAAISEYAKTLSQRKQEIYDFAGLFERISLKSKVSGKQLIKNLQGQVTVLSNWSTNLRVLAKRGVDEGLIAELQKIGPKAGAEVAGLVRMTDKQLNKYVALWREKNRLATNQATSELARMKQETDKKIQALQSSLTPLGISLEKFKQTWASALKPFVDLWGRLAAATLNGLTAIGAMIDRLNKISPVFTQIAGMFILLTTLLVLILAPLAIGISLAGSFAVAFNVLWSAIGPLVTGLLAVIGTALAWAAAIIAVIAVVYYLWNTFAGFRSAVLTIWNTIVTTIQTAINAVASFIQSKLTEIQAWWNQNGTEIMAAVQRVWGWLAPFIRADMAIIVAQIKTGWTIIKTVTSIVWAMIKATINQALIVIQGIITATAQLINGNWRGALTTMKDTAGKLLKNMVNMIKEILSSLASGAKEWGMNMVQMLADGIGAKVGEVITAAKRVASAVKNYLGFSSPTKLGPASKSDKWAPNFMDMFSQGIKSGIPRLQVAVSNTASIMAQLDQPGTTPTSPTYNINIQAKEAKMTERDLLRTLKVVEYLYG